MLKANTKKFIENLKKWIIDNYTNEEGEQEKDINVIVDQIVKDFKPWLSWPGYKHSSSFDVFIDYASGLPGSLFDFINEGNARDILIYLFEESEQEAQKFNNRNYDEALIGLIYSKFIVKRLYKEV